MVNHISEAKKVMVADVCMEEGVFNWLQWREVKLTSIDVLDEVFVKRAESGFAVKKFLDLEMEFLPTLDDSSGVVVSLEETARAELKKIDPTVIKAKLSDRRKRVNLCSLSCHQFPLFPPSS